GCRAVVDEQRERSTSRDGLDAERAGAGKEIEHARALKRIAIGMRKDVEHGLAQTIRGRADRLRRRRSQVAAPQSSADHAHHLLFPRLEIALAVIAAPGAARRAVAVRLPRIARACLLAAGPLHQHAPSLAIGHQRALARRLERLFAARRFALVVIGMLLP